MESTHCDTCNQQTEHTESMVRKPSKYDNNKTLFGRLMLFVHEFINGGNYHNMDRYLTCKVCKTRTLHNVGNEFE